MLFAKYCKKDIIMIAFYIAYILMKDKNFSIKISDLLNQSWSVDEISFENKFSEQLPNLTDDGISWSFVIQSLNDSDIIWTLKNLKCNINDICDSCQKEFVRDVNIHEYIAKFSIQADKINKEAENQ